MVKIIPRELMVFIEFLLWPHLPYLLTAHSKDGYFVLFAGIAFSCFGKMASTFPHCSICNYQMAVHYIFIVATFSTHGMAFRPGTFSNIHAMYGRKPQDFIIELKLHLTVCAHAIYMHLQDCLYELVVVF